MRVERNGAIGRASQPTWLWAVGRIWWERQGISGRKRNPYRGMSAPKDNTPVLREAPFMLLECVGGKLMMGPEIKRG